MQVGLASREFFLNLRVQPVFGKRYILCENCGERARRSIVPHLKTRHKAVWEAAVADWLELKNGGMTYRQIMRSYTAQEDQYILSWTVIKREVKALAETRGGAVHARAKKRLFSWSPEPDIRPDSTIWSFPERGSWAVHDSDYEGNWSPYVPREAIRQFSQKGDLILDPFVGGGTTLVECVLLGRRGIGVDVSPHALAHSRQRLAELRRFAESALVRPFDLEALAAVDVQQGDARDLSFLDDESVDMICTHPPYSSMIQYTSSVKGDLSLIESPKDFVVEMEAVAREFRRVLKPGRFCVILIGDIRKNGLIEPLGLRVLQVFKDLVGFDLVETVIKMQHQDSSTEFYYRKKSALRYRLAHEYLFVFRRPFPPASNPRVADSFESQAI